MALTPEESKQLGEQLRLFGFRNYGDFLASPVWKNFSWHLHSLPRYKSCVWCGSTGLIDLDHINYSAILDPRTIRPLCHTCHEKRHGKIEKSLWDRVRDAYNDRIEKWLPTIR